MMVNTEEQMVRGINDYLGTIVDMSELVRRLNGEGEMGEGQRVVITEDEVSGALYTLDGKYELQVRRIK